MEGATIGKRCKIQRAIIDKFAVVPDGSIIGYDLEQDRRRFTVSEHGIVVIPRLARVAEPSRAVEASPHPLARVLQAASPPFLQSGK